MSRDQFDPKSPNYSLYQMQLFSIKRSYPGGNFEENQQLNDSMSISPLYTTVSIDLHVRTPVGPPPVFQQASPSSCKDHHLSGCIRINFAQILQKNSDRQNVPGPFLNRPLPSYSLSLRISFLVFSPQYFQLWCTPWSVFQDGIFDVWVRFPPKEKP